ncbi:MAG: hypothetical protein EXQ89_07635 [Rhodospirillaceae bacterium]|nr:hypothetical protein [Rhodospirillaceae bacterium]
MRIGTGLDGQPLGGLTEFIGLPELANYPTAGRKQEFAARVFEIQARRPKPILGCCSAGWRRRSTGLPVGFQAGQQFAKIAGRGRQSRLM